MHNFLKLSLLGLIYTATAFDLEDYATTYRATRDAYLKAANELKLATGPYKAARDAYVAATATYTKSLYERRRLDDVSTKSTEPTMLKARPTMLKASEASHLKILQEAYWHAGSSESQLHTAESIEKLLSHFSNIVE
tara:strand:+ start:2314 stop:2724 length:411 start_codon:yes stop_codon:yes gene_type:complete